MNLTERQKKHLRGLGHSLKPIILVGQSGDTPGVRLELDRALTDHELVKVKVRGVDRAERDELLSALASASGASLVQRIGNVALLYRPHPERPRIMLPDA